MKIGIDFEGVIANTPKLKAELARKIYNKSIPPSMFDEKFVVGSQLITLEQYKNIERTVFCSENVYLEIEELDNSVSSLKKLLKKGIEITIFSDTEKTGKSNIEKWLKKQGLNMPIGIPNSVENLNLFISSDLKKLKSLKPFVKNLFLYIWGFNKDLDCGYSIRRFNNWAELTSYISNMAGL